MIVLDASALVDVLLDQPPRDWVLDRLRGEQILAPAHQPAEVVSALGRLVRAATITEEQAQDAVAEATALRQEHLPLTRQHLQRALELSTRVRILDGLYVAVAEDHEATLVTTDRRLAGTGLPVSCDTPWD